MDENYICKMKKDRILFLVPGQEAKGGVSNYYRTIQSHFVLNIIYFQRGARNWPNRKNAISEAARTLSDWIWFLFKLIFENYKLVQTSTSLGKFSVIRDSVFLYISRLLGKKTVVFYHGWNYEYKKELEANNFGFFKKTFLKADTSIVLSSEFGKELLAWGYKNPIYTETTVVEESLVADISGLVCRNSEKITFLFLSRVEKAKGIYEALDGYALLKKKYQNSKLIVAGDGFELENAKLYVKKNNIVNVDFRGFITGKAKQSALLESDILIFPSYSEGMPISVLEAMAFGLTILATKVGGLRDILADEKTGFFINEKDHVDIYEKASVVIDNFSMRAYIFKYNRDLAAQKFYAKSVAHRLEKIFSALLK